MQNTTRPRSRRSCTAMAPATMLNSTAPIPQHHTFVEYCQIYHSVINALNMAYVLMSEQTCS